MHIGFWRSQGKQTCGMETTQFAGNFSLGQMSCKSFLKSQVGIISLGTFLVFCEARATRAHDPMDSRLLRLITSTTARCLTSSDMSESVFQEVEFLEQAKGLQSLPLEDLSAVSACDQNGSD